MGQKAFVVASCMGIDMDSPCDVEGFYLFLVICIHEGLIYVVSSYLMNLEHVLVGSCD